MATPLRLNFRPDQQLQYLERITCLRLNFIRNKRTASKTVEKNEEKEDFRVLQLFPKRQEDSGRKREFSNLKYPPSRTSEMAVDQDWTSVWPGIRTFHPHVVPLPLRQGCNKHGAPPNKYANTELMKIPNFLHLTPPAIKKHCLALQEFCTEWPKSLNSDSEISKHFPVEVITSDYCHSSPTIRDPEARIVTLKVKLKDLQFDEHSKDKFLRLVGARHDPETDVVTITTDSCPLKRQNYDYAQYLLTALYFESWKTEEWEKEKSAEDMERYIFSERKSNKNVKKFFDYNKRDVPPVTEFGKSVEDWMNEGDSKEKVENYKRASLKLLSLG